MRNAKALRTELRRLDLLAYYRAVNTRYFGGKLPNDITMIRRSCKIAQKISSAQFFRIGHGKQTN